MAELDYLGGEPSPASQFLFEVDGVVIGMFREVSGLELSVEVEDFAEGGQNGFVHHFPGRMSWPNLVLKRGLVESDAFFEWVNKSSGEGFAANDNTLKRATGAVTVVDSVGTRLRTWSFDSAFAVRWSGPQLSVDAEGTLEESLEISHQGFRSRKP